VAVRPEYSEAHNNLGVLLAHQGKAAEAEQEYRQALRSNPDFAEAHFNLGMVLKKQGRAAEAEQEYRQALRSNPDAAKAHFNLGVLLYEQGKAAEAEQEYRQALRSNPDFAQAHYNLGVLLAYQGKAAEVEQEYRQALRSNPDDAKAHLNLGNLLADQGKAAEAEQEYRAALRSNPDDALVHYNLGLLLLEAQGKFTLGLEELHRAEQLLPPNDPRQAKFQASFRRWQALADLDCKLPVLLQNQVQPADAAEAVRAAQLCQRSFHQLYVAAARFYTDAFAAEPKLAEDPQSGNRYNAACVAALAGCGQGKDARLLDDEDGVSLRRQALAWLRADLDAWAKLLDGANLEQRQEIIKKLKHWQEDRDLAGVRDTGGLAKLPENEGDAWRKLWADVDALLQRAQQVPPGEVK
jgi:tetratricopeptide (TPR) repeat protein